VGDIEHDIVGSPVLDEGLELIFDVLGLLTRESRDWIISVESLRRDAVTVLAIRDLALKFVC
jgi:hypothetical protein